MTAVEPMLLPSPTIYSMILTTLEQIIGSRLVVSLQAEQYLSAGDLISSIVSNLYLSLAEEAILVMIKTTTKTMKQDKCT